MWCLWRRRAKANAEAKTRAEEEDAPAPTTPRFLSSEIMRRPASPDSRTFNSLLKFSREQREVDCNYEYWGSCEPGKQWRDGATKEVVADACVIASEEAKRQAILREDAATAGTAAHADLLHARGVTVSFLLALTFELDLWAWPTWKVVTCLVRPATSAFGRCRFADLAVVAPFTGPATVFLSHCWGGAWGDLVAAACGGARQDRVVWLDVFAVRQVPRAARSCIHALPRC